VQEAPSPGDSGFELLMADALIAAGRSFAKPLRYDQGDALFPDYVLVDVEPNVAVEVFGVKGRELYDLRRRTKLALYQQPTAMPLLQWDVAEPLPDVHRR
jgi:hypothetical protein